MYVCDFQQLTDSYIIIFLTATGYGIPASFTVLLETTYHVKYIRMYVIVIMSCIIMT